MDPTPNSPPPSLEELTMRSATTLLLLPYILTMSPTPPRHVAVFVNPATRSVTLAEGFLDLESILNDIISSKDGPLPASKDSIAALPVVKVSDTGMECPVCLTEVEVDGEVKEMPCKHRFCKWCIDKWLGIHGSCPVCRFSMPVVDEEKDSGQGLGNGRNIRVVFVRDRADTGQGNDESVEMDMDVDIGEMDNVMEMDNID